MHLIITTPAGDTTQIHGASQAEANRLVSELSRAGQRVRVGVYAESREEQQAASVRTREVQ